MGRSISILFIALWCLPFSALGETFTLELKRVPGPRSERESSEPSFPVYHMSIPQSLNKTSTLFPSPELASRYDSIVEKEPESIRGNEPFRGVFRLGGLDFAFLMDSEDPATKGYDRIYLDRNRNGDLADEEPVEAYPLGLVEGVYFPGPSPRDHRDFPAVEVRLEAEGEEYDYAFSIRTRARSSHDGSIHAFVDLRPAVYRQGEAVLDGRQRKLFLFDFNSNGRFDDYFRVREGPAGSEGGVTKTQGDKIFLGPDLSTVFDGQLGSSGSSRLITASRIIDLEGRFYDLEISPSGGRMTFGPSTRPVGYAANPNEGLTAVLFGELGMLRIGRKGGTKHAVPAGKWRLAEYTLFHNPVIRGDLSPYSQSRTMIRAEATADSPWITILEGKATYLPLGPPLKPVTVVSRTIGRETRGSERSVRLELVIRGVGGEVLNGLTINGRKPKDPVLVIRNMKGEEVSRGNFDFG